MAVKPKAFKELYAKAAGRCAMCSGFESVFKDKICEVEINNKNISEAAHVIAQSKKGPRAEEGYTGDIDGYDNLILLCPTHHKAVDDNPENFPSNWLRNKKKDLEQWVNNSLKLDGRRNNDINSLSLLMQSLAFTRIRSYCEGLPDSFYFDFFETGTTLDNFPIDLPDARPFFDSVLESKFAQFEQSYRKLEWILTGGLETDKNGTISIYLQATSRGGRLIVPLNKGELYAHKESFDIQNEIRDRRDNFLRHYLELMQFLRFNYPEVDINSYESYKFE
ncbi:HNH endonuclease signature motif containing protein [Pseudomonas viridiflava]|uniref:HNH endonuclease signature motif containing protein n=1 Tax=Pseudomonas viridiflava TaxID=33069 RepID=UPI002EC92472|nr:HNH endonuclease signature motif containing protein [Pseudomonas viridiflava]